ncbi:hypothetical protein F5Y11DRAFT_368145 [Daldinia sp. FL1419]|nr:hypothetical protein F5Y11DRAFT_368145 [Daldinia sp. FL1419]
MLTEARLGHGASHLVGDVPAVSLTRDISPTLALHSTINILLLECGDIRNLLFTVHSDERKLDFTCCDTDETVIARNILFFSLLVEEEVPDASCLWDLYFHPFVDSKSRRFIQSRATELSKLSNTLKKWRASKFGARIRFYDSATLADVHNVWKAWGTPFLSEARGGHCVELENAKASFADALKSAREAEAEEIIPTNIRSCYPVITDEARNTLSSLHQHFLLYGTVELNERLRDQSQLPNPLFTTRDGQVIIHKGIDPLHGFNLSPAFTEFWSESFSREVSFEALVQRTVDEAHAQFSQWSRSLVASLPRVTMRFVVGDSLAFAHTLNAIRKTSLSGSAVVNTANWYRHRYNFQPMVLDGLNSRTKGAALKFDVIDTSTLYNTVGPINLLVAVSPLISHRSTSAVIYTEVIGINRKLHEKFLKTLFCGRVKTFSILVGLLPVEYWTGVTSFSTRDERMSGLQFRNPPDIVGEGAEEAAARRIDCHYEQERWGIRWKRQFCDGDGITGSSVGLLRLDLSNVAEVMANVFGFMFSHANEPHSPSQDFSYNVASFGAFLKLIVTRVDGITEDLLYQIRKLISDYELCGQQLWETLTYFNMFGLISVDTLAGSLDKYSPPAPTSYRPTKLRPKPAWKYWQNISPIVCITIRIDRRVLPWTTNDDPNLCLSTFSCFVKWGFSDQREIFRTCQLGFGNVQPQGSCFDESFSISIEEDPLGWKGNSPLVASFYVPSCCLEALEAALVGSRIDGVDLHVDCIHNDEDIFITPYAPSQHGLPFIPGFMPPKFMDYTNLNPNTTKALIAPPDSTGQMTSRDNTKYHMAFKIGGLTPWNISYLDLEECPVITVPKKNANPPEDRFFWLCRHVDYERSPQELELGDNYRLRHARELEAHLNYRKTFYTIVMEFATKCQRLFVLRGRRPSFKILVYNLRLDPSSRAVVLDCGVIFPDVRVENGKFILHASTTIQSSEEELQLWEHNMPFYIKRCKTRSRPHRRSESPVERIGWRRLDDLQEFTVRAAISPPFWSPFGDRPR